MLKEVEHIPNPQGANSDVALDDRHQQQSRPRSISPDSEDMDRDGEEDEEQTKPWTGTVFNVVMMGDSGVGKTDLIGRLCESDEFKTKFFATIGINMESHIIDSDGNKAKLQIWDPSGSERFRKVVTQYFPIAKGIVFVYDINYDKSFQSIQQWIRLVQTHPSVDLLLPKCLIGNKCDMGANRRMVSSAEGESLASTHRMRFFETSSISGLNVQEAFATLCQDMHKHNSCSVPSQPVMSPG